MILMIGGQVMQSAWPGRCTVDRLVGVIACLGMMSWGLVDSPAGARAQDVLPAARNPVGMTQIEFVDPAEGGRPLDLMLIYPAAPAAGAVPFKVFLATNLHLYKDAPVMSDGLKHPLVMFSHGAGGNGSVYAWFGEYLASHGYLVAMVYHYRANTYEFERALRAQQDLAAPARHQPGHLPPAPGQASGGRTSTRIRLAWRGIRKGVSRRSGSAAPRSIPSCSSPISADGRTTRWCRPICASR